MVQIDYALQVVILGFAVVSFALILLYGVITLLGYLLNTEQKTQEKISKDELRDIGLKKIEPTAVAAIATALYLSINKH